MYRKRQALEEEKMDVNRPVENPSLIASIKALLAKNNEQNQNEMINEVIRAKFLTPVIIAPDPTTSEETGKKTFPKGTAIGFITLQNENNEEFFLAFTDWQELKKWRDKVDEQTLIVSYADLSSLVLDDKGRSGGFVINPYSDDVVFKKTLIEEIKKQTTQK